MANTASDVRVRLATPEEYGKIAEISMLSFANDPLLNYLVGATEPFDMKDSKAVEARMALQSFFVNAVAINEGRITVVVDERENIRAGCLWLPPQRRLSKWDVQSLYNAGMLSVLQKCGLGTYRRIFSDYEAPSEVSTKECYEACGSKESPMDSWYLQMTFTHPEHQGKKYLSLLLREAFAYAPDCAFTLESTTPHSRDRYEHLGFEARLFRSKPTLIIIGKGKANAKGLPASGEDATGLESWAMVKWPSVKKDEESSA
ncbi:hypothetical protein CPC08DRAFT_818980 [Agrocybe pediades]|nr:hypothetical protein CPC08DRAFT_818980 [Agrocybe pediades]